MHFVVSGGWVVGWSGGVGGRVAGYGHCSVTVLARFCTLFLARFCPSLPYLACQSTPYMHSSLPVWCAYLVSTLPVHPGYTTPGTPPATVLRSCSSTALRVSPDTRGAHSRLHRWTDSLGSSPGPLLAWVLPADRHPLFATGCHPAVP